MLNIDFGGAKHPDTQGGKWKIMDIAVGSDYEYDINSGKPLPLESDVVDNYYMSMTLEHVSPDLVLFVLREILRTLKKGGTIRIVVPDFEIGMQWYFKSPKMLRGKGRPHKASYYPDTKLGHLLPWIVSLDNKNKPDKKRRSGHKTGFDFETLGYQLRKAGFTDIKKLKYGKCSKVYEGKDLGPYHEYGLYVEATKGG